MRGVTPRPPRRTPRAGLEPSSQRSALLEGVAARVLFVCTHNKARSQLAEGLLRRMGGAAVEVHSAGNEPSAVHPMAIRVLDDMGIDSSRQRSKHLKELSDQTFDYVITVCDRVREVCPTFRGSPRQVHWSLHDPASIAGSDAAQYQAFAQTARRLEARIRLLLSENEARRPSALEHEGGG